MILDLIAVCSNAGMEEDKDVHIDMDTFSSQLGVFPIIKKRTIQVASCQRGEQAAADPG